MKGFISLPILVVVLVIASGTIIYYQKTKDHKVVISEQISPSPSTQQISSPSASPSAKKMATPKPSVKPSVPPKPTFDTSVKLESISPQKAKFQETITLKGSGFGNSTHKVRFFNLAYPESGPIMTTIQSWTDNEIKVSVPWFKGKIEVEVEKSDGTKSNRLIFESTASQPYISSTSSNALLVGKNFTIYGTEFGLSTGTIKFYHTDALTLKDNCSISFWSDTEIRCTVPTSLSIGQEFGLQIVTSDSRESSFKYMRASD